MIVPIPLETVLPGFVALTLPSESTDMFRTYWFPRKVLSGELDKDDSDMSKESPVQPAPQPASEALSNTIKTLDDEDQISTPKLVSRVCGRPSVHGEEMGGRTPLNLSAAIDSEEAVWINSASFFSRTRPARYESSDSENDNCHTQ